MRKIKVKVNSGTECAQIQRIMFEMGYEWGRGKVIDHLDAKSLYGEFDGSMTYGWDGIAFDASTSEEYVLQNGKLIPTNEFVPEFDKQPAGLRPRNVASAGRMCEILQAMRRYVKNGKQIPSAWMDELEELNQWIEIKEK